MFGEQALVYKKKRAAHCIVLKDNSNLCVMHGKDFDRIFGALHRREEEKKKLFIEKEILTDPEMRSLARVIGVNFTKRHYFKNHTLFSKGDRPDKLYFIYRGQILIWDDCVDNHDVRLKKDKPKERRTKAPLMLDFAPIKAKRFDIMLSGPGKMVGEEELFTGFRRRYYATIESECVVYEIEFDRMINVCLDNHFVRNILKQKILDKISLINCLSEYKKKAEQVRTAFDEEEKTGVHKKTGLSVTIEKHDHKKILQSLAMLREEDERNEKLLSQFVEQEVSRRSIPLSKEPTSSCFITGMPADDAPTPTHNLHSPSLHVHHVPAISSSHRVLPHVSSDHHHNPKANIAFNIKPLKERYPIVTKSLSPIPKNAEASSKSQPKFEPINPLHLYNLLTRTKISGVFLNPSVKPFEKTESIGLVNEPKPRFKQYCHSTKASLLVPSYNESLHSLGSIRSINDRNTLYNHLRGEANTNMQWNRQTRLLKPKPSMNQVLIKTQKNLNLNKGVYLTQPAYSQTNFEVSTVRIGDFSKEAVDDLDLKAPMKSTKSIIETGSPQLTKAKSSRVTIDNLKDKIKSLDFAKLELKLFVKPHVKGFHSNKPSIDHSSAYLRYISGRNSSNPHIEANHTVCEESDCVHEN